MTNIFVANLAHYALCNTFMPITLVEVLKVLENSKVKHTLIAHFLQLSSVVCDMMEVFELGIELTLLTN